MDSETWRQAKRCLIEWAKRHLPTKAEQVLERLLQEAAVNTQCVANATMYNECMNAWIQSRVPNAPLRAQDLLMRMQERHNEVPLFNPAPDTVSYNTVLHGWALSKAHDATQNAEELIRFMETKSQTNPAVAPTTWSYNLVILAYANRVGEYGSAKAAEDWLLRLSKLSAEQGAGVSPDKHSFNLVLKAWANSEDEKGPDRAFEILRLMVKLSNEGHEVKPDPISFVTVINSFAKRGRAMEAQETLYLSQEVDLPQNANLTPCFNAVIDAWAKSGATDAGSMAEIVLKNAVSFSKTSTGVIVRPNDITYTACLDAHAKSDNPNALENAEKFLRDMITSFQTGESRVAPTTFTFTCIVNAWAKSNNDDSAEKAESWLMRMKDLSSKNDAFKCDPDNVTYNLCIDTWARNKAPNAGARAARLLQQMEQLYERGSSRMRPSGFSYRVVIKRLLSSQRKEDALHALMLVKRMEQQAHNGNMDARPDIVTCNRVIKALVATEDERAIEGALKLLRGMEQTKGKRGLQPDTLTYTYVMSGLAKIPDPGAKRQAVKLFDQMKELSCHPKSPVRLDGAAFRIALEALTGMDHDRAVDKAEELLLLWETESQRNANIYRPDTFKLNTVLRAWSKSNSEDKASRARKLLEKMNDRADIISYNTLLNAAAFTSGSREATQEALLIATATFAEIKASSRLKPDEVTYGTVLKACERFMMPGEEKVDRMKSIFRQCCDDGLAGKMAIEQMRKVLPEGEINELAHVESSKYCR